MFGAPALGLLLLAPAAPVPAPPPPPAVAPADRGQAVEFARLVYSLAANVSGYYARPVEVKDLIAGAIRGIYEEAGLTPPDEAVAAAGRAPGPTELVNVLADARVRLGDVPALRGPRAFFAAANGFKHATDQYCGLAGPRVNTVVSVDMDFGIGLELDGVGGQPWAVYRVERGIATGAFPAHGIFGRVPKPDEIASPAAFPWRVKRVIPGSPAQKAGVKPGDVITHLDGAEVTAEAANKLFVRFAFPPGAVIDPVTGQITPVKRALRLTRAEAPGPVALTLETQFYLPETVHGVIRTGDGKWDGMLDREHKIGYLRVGAVEQKADDRATEILADLQGRGCRGLILDLRWCPGGYVTQGTNLAGLFLKANDPIAVIRAKRALNLGAPPGVPNEPVTEVHRAAAGFKFLDVPVVALVGSETTGGGELIAAALKDNGRCVILGQRTAGRAAIQNTIDTGFGGLQFKVTTGTTLRPDETPRQRNPDSQPTDNWGVRPDPGFEVPVTPDLAARLRAWAEEHALRPADSREALPFDDPVKDPYRVAALAYLRNKLGKP